MKEQSFIDLRSDTVTRPTPAMRKAMAESVVGDDNYGDDPTVNRLQEQAAALIGKEAALFVPTGTMGNQIAIRLHTEPGQEVITEERGHIFNFEMAAMAVVSGTLARTIRAEDGILDVESIRKAIRPKMYNRAQTGLITLENTHNYAGGTVVLHRAKPRDRRLRSRPRHPRSPRRRPHLQRRDRPRLRGQGSGQGFRLGDVLSFQGALRARRLTPLR